MPKMWRDLRNKIAHADELDFSDEKHQEFLNPLYGCLELFYRLILAAAAYNGRICCYSKFGWPDDVFSSAGLFSETG